MDKSDDMTSIGKEVVLKNECRSIYVTHLESLGPYLLVYGQLNPGAVTVVQNEMVRLLPDCFIIDSVRHHGLLRPGIHCLHKRDATNPNGCELRRVVILKVIPHHAFHRIEVEFIDYGFKDVVFNYELLFTQHQEVLLPTPPKLCSQFIVLGICKDWQQNELDDILQMLKHQTVQICIQMEFRQFKLIVMKWKEFNIAEFLIGQRKLGAPITNELLLSNFIKMIKQQKNTNSLSSNGISNDKFAKTSMNEQYSRQPVANRLLQYQLKGSLYAPILQHHTTIQSQPNMHTRISQSMSNVQPIMKDMHIQGNGHINGHQSVGVHILPPFTTYVPQIMRSCNTVYPMRYPPPMMTQPGIALDSVKSIPYSNVNQTRAPIKQNSIRRTIATAAFQTNTLTVGQTYDVRISYAENGPSLFSIQLISMQDELLAVMNSIEQAQLTQMTEKPVAGSACIARYSVDRQLYRALIIATDANICEVVYVDYGNSEWVKNTELYEIPMEFLAPKAFAIRFTLSRYKELEPISDNLKRTFRDLVMYQNSKLKVVPLEGAPSVQYGEIYMQYGNVLDKLKRIQAARLVFPKAELLKNNDIVEVRYIDTPKNFYVQQICNIESFEQLMDEMFVYYNKNQKIPSNFQLGAPCVVQYESDWYRAEIIQVDSESVVVRHVDFGYEQNVVKNHVSIIADRHLKLPRQAVNCCLKGFENNELNKDMATTQFEMLAEGSDRARRPFTVKVFRIQPNGMHIVNLLDKELNVMKKLYKLSLPFEEYLSLEKGEFKIPINNTQEKTNVVSQHNISAEETPLNTSSSIQDLQSNTSQTVSKKVVKQEKAKTQQPQSSRQPTNPAKGIVPQVDKTKPLAETIHIESSDHITNNNQRQSSQPRDNEEIDSLNSSIVSNNSSIESGRSPSGKKNKRGHPQNAQQGFSQQRNNKDTTGGGSGGKQQLSDTSAYISSVSIDEPDDYIALTEPFIYETINVPTREEVTISWWISPYQFYTQIKSRQSEFEHIMKEMQVFYKNKTPQHLQLKVGSTVVARYRKENSLYRARILACNQMLRKYKVFFVDVGNQCTVTSEDIWRVEKRFLKFPCMANLCSFNGIVSNYDHLYIIDRMEEFLPNGANIICEFIQKAQDGYHVNMKVNKTCLKESLKTAGLISEVSPDLQLDLLADQQIRARLSSIKDMLNFKIQIEGFDEKIKLLASYDDVRYVKSNPEISGKFIKFYEGKSCVINITSVNDNKVLFVRPLLPLFKSDIPSNICTYPIFLSRFDAMVVHVSANYRLFVQMCLNVELISKLLSDMYDFYEKEGVPLQKFENGQSCAAKSEDGNWYRARIVAESNALSNNQLNVYYPDYGNMELVMKSNLKRLEENFTYDKSAFAIGVNLPVRGLGDQKNNVTKNNDEHVTKELQNLVLEQRVTVQPIMVWKNHLIGDVIIKNTSLIDTLKNMSLIKNKDVEYVRKLLDKENPNVLEYMETVDLTLEDEEDTTNNKAIKNGNYLKTASVKMMNEEVVKTKNITDNNDVVAETKNAALNEGLEMEKKELVKDVKKDDSNTQTVATVSKKTAAQTKPPAVIIDPYADMEKAVLSHCDNPTQFYIHRQDKISTLRKLQENLQIIAGSLPPLVHVEKGTYCISLYSVDKQWYRAKIMDAELMALQFIDFGNTDCISDPNEMKQMIDYQHADPMCLPCALPIKPKGTSDWVDAANAIFNESYNKILHIDYITRGDTQKRSFVNLYIDGINIAEKLIADGFAEPLEFVTSGANCYISHANSLNDFYIQYEKDSKALELMEIHLANNEDLKPLEKFERSKIVAAKFSDDGMWYRAKLLRQDCGKGYDVMFVDYGNTSVSTDCREIPEEIAKLPPLSQRCALELPDCYESWSEAAELQFSEIVASGETVFTVSLYEPAMDHSVVRLHVDGRNINEELVILCDKAKTRDTALNDIEKTSATLYDDGVISYAKSAWDFHVQLKKSIASLEELTNKLNTISLEELTEPKKGQLCAAIFSVDGQLYRARILDVICKNNKTICKVYFIDYGNVSESSELKELPQDLQNLNEFAVHCQLENDDTLLQSDDKWLRETFDALITSCDGQVKLQFLDKASKETAIVKLLMANTNEDILKKIRMLLPADALLMPSRSLQDPNKTCVISHANSAEHFYIQLRSDAAVMEMVGKKLSKKNDSNWEKLNNIEVGVTCCAFSVEDNCYYRGKIHNILNDSTFEIYLMDHGYIVTAKKLYALPEDLQAIPPLALKCQLSSIPNTVSVAALDEMFLILVETHFGESYTIEEDIVDANGLRSVKLIVNYKDVVEELLNMLENNSTNLEASAEVVLHDCVVTHVNSLSSFYIQLMSATDALSKISESLLSAESDLPILATLKVGTRCAAQFTDDLIFYRAEITEILDEEAGKCEVHFIDYGNTGITDQLRALPEHLLNEEVYGKHCSLDIDVALPSDANTRFETFINSRFPETFQIELLQKSNELNVVRLFYQKNGVLSFLQKESSRECEDAY